MMSAPEAISIVLDADAAVTAIRDDRFFVGLNLAPGEHARPYQFCDQRDKEVERHMTGRTGFVRFIVELESYANDADTCISLAKASREALDEYSGTVTDGSDSFDFVFLRLDDENDIAVVPIAGRDKGAAVIRQSYRLMQRTTEA